jgi:ABC-type glutathione transport system ATPase component
MSAMPPEDAAPVLSVRDLTVEFVTRRGTLRALDRISFDVARGEVLGVVGESGAGKSVTGSAIIGLIDPPGRISGGEVRLSGERIDNLPDDAMRKVRGKRIGMIFQDPLTSLNPLYRISEQLIETIQVHTDLDASQARDRAIAGLRTTILNYLLTTGQLRVDRDGTLLPPPGLMGNAPVDPAAVPAPPPMSAAETAPVAAPAPAPAPGGPAAPGQ